METSVVAPNLGLESLKNALVAAAGDFGRPSNATVLFSGIPLPHDDNVSDFIEQVCHRSGLVVSKANRYPASGIITTPALTEYEDGTFVYLPADGDQSVAVDPHRRVKQSYSISPYYANTADRASIGSAGHIERSHWLAGPATSFWRGYLSIAVAALLINILAVASPIFIMNVYDRILPNKATSSLIALAVGVFLAMVFDLLLKSARSKIIDGTGREIDQRVSYSLFDKVLHSKLAVQPASTGEFADRVSQIDFVREFFTSNTVATLIDAVFVFVFLFVIYLIIGWIFLIPATALVLSVLIGLFAQYRMGKLVARSANESSRRQALLVESISTIETIKALRAEATLLRAWADLTRVGSKTTEEIKYWSSQTSHLTQFIQQLVSVVVVVAGAYEFAEGNVTTGAIIAAVMLSSRTVAPLTQIALTLARLRQAMLSLRILNDIMALDEDRPSSTGFVNRTINSGAFQFDRVSFAYPTSDMKVLHEVSFVARAGERIGIIGKIGSGKTTVGRLLSGLYDANEGRVLVDGIDVRQYHPAELRGAVGFLGQSVDLFSGTLKENLKLANSLATDEEIIAAAKKTGVDDYASSHPRGYDLAVGERGSNLSGGQRQAVAITRLLLSDPKIIFLDEPSGSLDLATERQLIGNLARSFGPDVTLVISTHRYSLLELVDRLIVLDRGRIIADGPKVLVLKALEERARANAAPQANTAAGS